jgi:hypothetical protein
VVLAWVDPADGSGMGKTRVQTLSGCCERFWLGADLAHDGTRFVFTQAYDYPDYGSFGEVGSISGSKVLTDFSPGSSFVNAKVAALPNGTSLMVGTGRTITVAPVDNDGA